jgi:hypothetical protein
VPWNFILVLGASPEGNLDGKTRPEDEDTEEAVVFATEMMSPVTSENSNSPPLTLNQPHASQEGHLRSSHIKRSLKARLGWPGLPVGKFPSGEIG